MKKFLVSLIILVVGSFAFAENTFKDIDTAIQWLGHNFEYQETFEIDINEDIVLLSLADGIGAVYSDENNSISIFTSPSRIAPVDISCFINIVNQCVDKNFLGNYELYKYNW